MMGSKRNRNEIQSVRSRAGALSGMLSSVEVGAIIGCTAARARQLGHLGELKGWRLTDRGHMWFYPGSVAKYVARIERLHADPRTRRQARRLRRPGGAALCFGRKGRSRRSKAFSNPHSIAD